MKIVKTILSFAVLFFAVPMEGATVTLTGDTGEVTLQDNDVLTGTGGSETHVTVAAGATVTLRGVDITAIGDKYWSGITCAGSATIVLENSNVVKGGYEEFSGIYFPENCTLTIKGDGALDVRSNGYAAGIGCNGGDNAAPCGNILIQSGTITATGGFAAAGIGGTYGASCGSISIHGGTVTATGGQYAPGIGGSFEATCGNIEIKGGDTTVIATGGEYAPGIGSGTGSECADITISGGTVIATGGKDAPGIGSGSDAEGNAFGGVCGNIVIEESVTCVTANGGDNAPSSIGAGSGGVCGTVTVAGVVQAGGITTDPYIYNPCVTNITSAADWDAFASRVSRGVDSYEGKTVTLSADISVSTMVGKVQGNTRYPFSGTSFACRRHFHWYQRQRSCRCSVLRRKRRDNSQPQRLRFRRGRHPFGRAHRPLWQWHYERCEQLHGFGRRLCRWICRRHRGPWRGWRTSGGQRQCVLWLGLRLR